MNSHDEKFLGEVFDKYYDNPKTTYLAEQIEQLVYKEDVVMEHEDKVKVLTDFPTTYYFMSKEDWADRELAEIAVVQKPCMYALCSEELQNDEQLAIAVAKSPNLKYGDLGSFSHDMRENPKVVLEVAKQDVEHAFSRQINLDRHFEKNLNEDKYDTTCIKSLETEINYNELKEKLSSQLSDKPTLSAKEQYLEDFAKQSNGVGKTKSGAMKI